MSRVRAFRFVSLLLGWALCSASFATTVYTWIDAQGVRHFSQYPPADGEQPTETLNLETPPSAPESGERLQTIRDVARELESARQQREEQRATPAPPPAPPVEQRTEPPMLVVPYPAFPQYPGATPYPRPYPYPYPPQRPDGHKHKPERPHGPETDSPDPPPRKRVMP